MTDASDETAFVRVFRAEMDAAAAACLRETFIWVNRQDYGTPDDDLVRRADEWASQIEAAGKTWDVLFALAET